MMPVVPTAKRLNGFSIDSLMGKDTTSTPSSPRDAVTPRSADIPPMSAAFHPIHTTNPALSGSTLLSGLKHFYDTASLAEGLGHLAAGMPNHAALAVAAAAAGGLPPLAMPAMSFGGMAVAQANTSPIHPMLLSAHQRESSFPFYPWSLLSRHHNYLSHRLAGPEAGLLLQPFRKPKRIRTAFSPSQLLRLEHAFEKNHYVVGQERKDLASSLNLTETQVKVWFQNRRTKYKRMKAEENGIEYREEDDPSEPESDIDEDGPPSPKKSKAANSSPSNITRWQGMGSPKCSADIKSNWINPNDTRKPAAKTDT